MSPSIVVATGQAIDITSGKDNALTGIARDRPNQILVDPFLNDGNPRDYLNAAAFVQNAARVFRYLGHNAVHGPGRVNINASLVRTFALTERFKLEARWEAFNAINHVNYANPGTNLSSSTFGKITSTIVGVPGDPRIQQVSLKLHF